MSALAVLLVAVGCTDLLRPWRGFSWTAPILAPALVGLIAAICGLLSGGDLLPIGVAVLAAAAWELSCVWTERADRPRHFAPLIVFGAAVAILLSLSGFSSPVAGPIQAWWGWTPLDRLGEPDRLVMTVGVILLQLATGNQLVRLILAAVGAVKPVGQPQPSDHLKGGRLLGPMERLLIVGLSLAGQLTAATAVVAAKGIIRFPEINARRVREEGGIGIDDITEYFLIGSFASWIVALGGVALVAAA